MKKNYSDKELLDRRLAGILPQIDIAGQPYFIDLRLKELRAVSDPNKTIRLANMAMDREGENYLCFFHLPSATVVNVAGNIIAMPTDIVMLQIPNELRLDPVGLAREYGLEETFLLGKYPIREGLKAEVIPVEETGLPELIKTNLAKKQAAKKHRLRTGKRKGI